MASRRALGNFANTYLQYYLRNKQMQEQQGLELQRQQALADAQRQFQQQQYNQNYAERILKSLSSNTVAELPTDENIDLNLSSAPQGVNLPSRDQMIATRNARQSFLQGPAVTPVAQDRYDPTLGAKVQGYVNPYEASKGPAVQTEPTGVQRGEQEGAAKMASFNAFEGTPAYATTKANVENTIERLTRAGATSRAAGIAGASAGASERARLAPDIVSKEVGRAGQIAEVQAKAQAMYGQKQQPTESERKASGEVVNLITSAAKLKDMEMQGHRVQPMATSVIGNPVLSGLNKAMPSKLSISPQNLEYAQAVQDFVTTFGYMRSGVAINKEEIPRFMSIMGAQAGDPDNVVAAKQRSREVLIGVGQISAGRAGYDGGKTLATLINSGELPQELATTITFTNPEMKRGFIENLKGLTVK